MGFGHTYLTIISKTAHATSSVHIFYWYFNCIFWLPDESESLHVVWFSGLVKCLCDKQVFFSELCEFSVATQFVCSVSGAVRGSSIWICKHGMQPSLELKMGSFWPPCVWNISVVKIWSLATLSFVPARQYWIMVWTCVRLHQVLVFLIISESGCWCFEHLVASIYWTSWSRLSEAIVENCFCCMEPGVRRLRRTALNKRRSTRWSLLAIVGEAPVGNWLRTRWQSVLAYVGIPCMWASVCKVWYCWKQNNLHPFWRRLL